MSGCLGVAGSYGINTAVAVEPSDVSPPCDPAVFDDNSERYEILSERIVYVDNVVGSRGLTGTLDPIANHLRPGARVVMGQMLMEVGPYELANWLPRILGNDASGTTYTTTTDHELKPFDVLIKRDINTLLYRHCVVSSAMFQGREGTLDNPEQQVVRMGLSFIGVEEHCLDTAVTPAPLAWPDPEPSLPVDQRLFWLHGDSQLEMDNPTATAYPIDAFNLMIDNKLVYKTRNTLRVNTMRSSGREIRLQTPTPYTADTHSKYYCDRFDGRGRLHFKGTKNLAGGAEEDWITQFEFPRLYQTLKTPTAAGRGEMPLALDLTAYRTATTEPIIITNQLVAP